MNSGICANKFTGKFNQCIPDKAKNLLFSAKGNCFLVVLRHQCGSFTTATTTKQANGSTTTGTCVAICAFVCCHPADIITNNVQGIV